MLTTQQIREVAEAYIEAQSRGDMDALLALCADDVIQAGILVKKITGEPTGALQGKPAIRSFNEKVGEQMGPAAPAVRAIGIGINSAVVSMTAYGSIPLFTVLVMNDSGKITEIRGHQEMP